VCVGSSVSVRVKAVRRIKGHGGGFDLAPPGSSPSNPNSRLADDRCNVSSSSCAAHYVWTFGPLATLTHHLHQHRQDNDGAIKQHLQQQQPPPKPPQPACFSLDHPGQLARACPQASAAGLTPFLYCCHCCCCSLLPSSVVVLSTCRSSVISLLGLLQPLLPPLPPPPRLPLAASFPPTPPPPAAPAAAAVAAAEAVSGRSIRLPVKTESKKGTKAGWSDREIVRA